MMRHLEKFDTDEHAHYTLNDDHLPLIGEDRKLIISGNEGGSLDLLMKPRPCQHVAWLPVPSSLLDRRFSWRNDSTDRPYMETI